MVGLYTAASARKKAARLACVQRCAVARGPAAAGATAAAAAW